MYYMASIGTHIKGQKCKKTNMLIGWQLIQDEDEKLKRIDTQKVNKTLNNANNDIYTNTSSTSKRL